jgi:hypothetical protein
MDPGQNPSGFVVGVRHFDPALNDPNLLVEHVVAYDIEIRTFSQWNDFSGTSDHSGCLVTGNSRNTWILDSHLHHLRGPGISPSRTGAMDRQIPATNVFAARNYIHNCKEPAISFKNGANCIFAKNTCHTFRRSTSSLGYAIVVIDDDPTPAFPASDNIWIVFNTIYDSENGIWHELRNATSLAADKHSRSYIVGNLFFDIRLIRGAPDVDGIALHKGQLAESRIVGNTIYNCDQAIWLGFGQLVDAAHTTQVVRNNAIVDNTERFLTTNGQHGVHVYVTPSSIVPFTTIDHNLHFESVGLERFTVAKTGQVHGHYYSVGQLLASTGFGAASIEVNPPFVDPVNMDFHLVQSSLAASVGEFDDVYPLFRQLFGFNVSIDYYHDGTFKPRRNCAIGALPVKP